ncbi:E2F-associated phosphoprotein-like [Acanthaster planci]|uniref:E2F-associated phosphoprotein-like n=1 Tax=Acanthaster planci TaxID=133434 RepID=A0A8B8A019_ACAPL|nr:E2F-associated phosphoprotein-like [Acanthaster planci]
MSVFTERPKGFCQYDYIEEDSDQEIHGRDSSDDELDILLHGTPQQKRRLTRSLSRGSLEMSSSEDEFEKEMERELAETMRQHEQQFASAAESAMSHRASGSGPADVQSSGQPANTESQIADEFYNDIYFDSDDETEEAAAANKANSSQRNKKTPGKHRVFTNDELLYDPEIDDRNQEWVDRQRSRYYPHQTKQESSAPQAGNRDCPEDSVSTSAAAGKEETPVIPKSDAVLNCPACLTTLCLDCQRHELYTHQYRAMFVLNCTIVRSERLIYTIPEKARQRKKGRKKGHKRQLVKTDEAEGAVPSSATSQQEHYHPVRCSKCNTEVAVYDSDEVFHFFNVITSLS